MCVVVLTFILSWEWEQELLREGVVKMRILEKKEEASGGTKNSRKEDCQRKYKDADDSWRCQPPGER